jgi:hypothetical protein
MKYKIIVPKAGSANAQGTASRLYEKDEIVDASEPWVQSVMDVFLQSGWAMEIKVLEPESKVEVAAEVVAKNKAASSPKVKAKAKKKAAPKKAK